MFSSREGTEFESPDGSFELKSLPGTLTVTASAPGYEPASIGEVDLEPGQIKDDLLLRLKRGARLTGRVIDDSSGAPISEAAISWAPAGAAPASPRGWVVQVTGDAATTTDADGRFELSGLTEKERVTISAQEYSHLPASADAVAGVDGDVTLRMSSGAQILGRLTGRDGNGVPGGSIELQALGASMGSSSQTSSDASGNFEFDHVGPSTYRLSAQLGAQNASPQEVTVAPGVQPPPVVLSLSGGAEIVGRVTGLAASELGSVIVRASDGEGFNASATPSASGTYEIDGAPSGAIQMTALVRGFQGRSVSKTAEITEDAAQVEVDLDFPAASTLSGTVMRGGQPQSQLWISVSPQTPGAPSTTGRAMSDSDGRYSISGLMDGDYLVRAMSLPGSGSSAAHEEPVTISGDTSLDIDLPTLSISGTLVEHGSSDPVAAASVMADNGQSADSRGIPHVTTDSNGRFRIDGLAPGDFHLSATKAGWQTSTQDVSIGDTPPDVTLAMDRAEGITIHGFDGRSGLPLSQISALLLGGGGAVAFEGSVPLDSTGRGEIPQLSPGAYSAYFFASGYAPLAFGNLSIPSPPLTVSVTQGGEIDIRADPSSAGAIATLATADGFPYLSNPRDLNSQFATTGPLTARPHIAPGSYVLTIQWSAGPTEYPLTVVEGQVTTVSVP
jgi:protocatechuate 3,4-dioxygenase beta subunit